MLTNAVIKYFWAALAITDGISQVEIKKLFIGGVITGRLAR